MCQPRFTPVEQLPTLGERAGAVPCRATLCCAEPCHAVPRRAVPCCAVPRLLCHAAPCCAILRRAVPFCAVPCHTAPCCATPCCAAPCFTPPCRAVLCHAAPCRAVPCRGAGCSPLAAPPARAQAAGSVCWRLCAFQFLGHSPSKPLRGRRQLGAVTNNRRAPMTPAPGAECQHRGGSREGRGDAAPLLPSHSTRREGGRGGPAANTHGTGAHGWEGGGTSEPSPCGMWSHPGELLGVRGGCPRPQHPGHQHQARICAWKGDGAQRAATSLQQQRVWGQWGSRLVNVSWNVCRSRPGEIKGPRGAAGARWHSGAAGAARRGGWAAREGQAWPDAATPPSSSALHINANALA